MLCTQISEYKDVFSYFDYDNDGKITTREIRTAMEKMNIEINESELQDMVEKVDIDGKLLPKNGIVTGVCFQFDKQFVKHY